MADPAQSDLDDPVVQEYLKAQKQNAAASIIGATDSNPDEAAKTLRNSAQQGLPFSTGNLNPQRFNKDAETQNAINASDQDPVVAQYLANNDFAASVSKDDLDTLSKISPVLKRYVNFETGLFKAAGQAFNEGLDYQQDIPLSWYRDYPTAMKIWGPSLQALSAASQAMLKVPGAVVRGGIGATEYVAGQLGADETTQHQIARNLQDIANVGQVFLMEPSLIRGAQNRAAWKKSIEDTKQFVEQHKLDIDIKPYIEAQENPSPGVNPVIDQALIKETEIEHENYNELAKLVDESKTLERSPEAFKAFIDEAADGREIGIPANIIRELYGDKAASQFEWIPDFEKRLADAGRGDVKISLADWLTYGKDIRADFEDHVRLRDDGLTLDETDQLKKLAPETYTEPPVAKDLAQPLEEAKPPSEPIPEEASKADFKNARRIAKREQWLRPLFTGPEDVGMTAKEWDLYNRHVEDLDKEADQKVIDYAAKKIKQRQTAEWKRNETEVRDEVTDNLRWRPDLLADEFFRSGRLGSRQETRFKLDGNIIAEKYGEEFRDSLPRNSWVTKGGVDPGEAADRFGFQSDANMLDSLKQLEDERKDQGITARQQFDRLIEDRTAETMKKRYGDLGENILAEARDSIGTGGQARLLSDEVFALAKNQIELPESFTHEYMEKQVKEQFGERNAIDASKPERFIRETGRAGRDAELALLAKDYEEALVAKTHQFVSLLNQQEAKAFKKIWDSTMKIVERFSKGAVVDGVDQDYTDQIHGLLNSIGTDVPRTRENLGRALEVNLDKFVEEKAKEGRLIAPPVLPLGATIRPSKGSNLRPFTVNEFKAFSDTIKSLEYNGRREKQIQIGDRVESYEAAISEILQNIEEIKARNIFPEKKLSDNPIRTAARNLDATMLKPEQMFDWLDQGDPNGPFNRAVFRPLSEAEHWKLDTLRAMADDLKSLKQPRWWRRALKDPVENTTLLEPSGVRQGEPMPLDRGAMLKIALNWGNKSNKSKLLGGFGWREEDVQAFLNKNMTEDDWKYTQHVWDVLSKLAPEIEKRTRNLSGVAVDIIEPQEVVTPHGNFKGGYFPLIEDELSKINRARTSSDMMDQTGLFRMMPTANAVKARTGKLYPISLALDDLPNRVIDTVHYLAFAEPIQNARKILTDPLVRTGISEALGPEYTKQTNPWLEHVSSNGGLRDESGLHWVYKVSREGRANVQTMLIGFNPITAMLHGGSAFANSLQEVGSKNLGAFVKALPKAPVDSFRDAVDYFFKSPENAQKMSDFVYEKSGEIRNRKLKLDESFQGMWQRSLGRSTMRTSFSQAAMSGVAYLDLWSAIPTWKAVYDGALKQGIAESDAIYMADKAVRNAHGASGITDTAAIQRGNEIWKWSTMFMGYFVHNYSRNRDTSRIALGQTDMDNWGRIATVSSRTLMYLAIPAILHQALRGQSGKDENWVSWAASALLGQAGGGIPIVRDAIYGMESGRGASEPVDNMIDGMVAPAKDAMHLMEGKKVSPVWVKHAAEAPGWFAGLSTREIGRASQFMWDVHKGKEHPVGFLDWYRGLTTSHAKGPRRR
jgi:Large polyvalent protein associated domain 22